MKVLTLELPAMYGDHHVVEVRRILLGLDGIDEVYASSGFRAVEITYNPNTIKKTAIEAKLDDAGYLGELEIPVETGEALYGKNPEGSYYRHTASHGQTANVLSFTQKVNFEGRALWPCPGMEPKRTMDAD
ncbi:MAG: heavy-metal-associated domain-containing protein [Anaerolineae bacterium]|nr:heavy-metal-associated domain-containing protein [Anaerolineae bacterium]